MHVLLFIMKDIMIRAANCLFKNDTCPTLSPLTVGLTTSVVRQTTVTGRISSDRMNCQWLSRKFRPKKLRPLKNSQIFQVKGGMRSEFSRHHATVICSPVSKAEIDIIHTIHSLVFPVLIKEAEVFQLPQVVNVVSGVGYHTFRPILYEIGEK